MKKSLLALAALTAFVGAASAQSSVTLFGIVDAGFGRVSANGHSVTGISNSGINSSRFGVRGVEDLGGGLQAGFWLEGQLNNDVGLGASQAAGNTFNGLTFQRRSTVSLMGGFGEVRIGRDYTPTFWNTTVYDPFGTNGVASANTPGMLGGVNQANAVRANNSVSYFLPNMGGFSGQFMYAMGENLSGGAKTNNYFGFRLGYAAGPVSAHAAYGKTEGAVDAQDVKYLNLAASFDAGVVKPMLVYAQEKSGAGAKIAAIEVGIVAPVGAGEIRAAYSRYDLKNSSNDWNKLGLGYVHNLSKRTAVYAQFARVSNKGGATMAVANNGLSAGAAAAGGSSNGYEFGVRHAF